MQEAFTAYRTATTTMESAAGAVVWIRLLVRVIVDNLGTEILKPIGIAGGNG
jgi:hypothetical protein